MHYCYASRSNVWLIAPQADYPLNPYRRRAGKEGYPASFGTSLGTSYVSASALPPDACDDQGTCWCIPALQVAEWYFKVPLLLHRSMWQFCAKLMTLCHVVHAGTAADPSQEHGSMSRQMSASMSNYVSEAVIGSLPKGLTDQEKARVAASLPMSPAFNTLADLPKVRGGRACRARCTRLRGSCEQCCCCHVWVDRTVHRAG